MCHGRSWTPLDLAAQRFRHALSPALWGFSAVASVSVNSTCGIIITDVADHFGTFHIVNKCKQPPVQKYSQIRQIKTDNVLRFNNILANADYSSVLLSDCPNYAYHTFMEIYTNAFNQACPVESTKTPKRYIKRERWLQMVY